MATNELKILLTGDASRLSSSLKSASSKLKSFGSKISSVGASMQRFALPLAVAGGAAIKMAVDFDKSMTQIKTLVGVAGDEVDKMGEQVLVLMKLQRLFFILLRQVLGVRRRWTF
jgi:phage-related minor tail protein